MRRALQTCASSVPLERITYGLEQLNGRCVVTSNAASIDWGRDAVRDASRQSETGLTWLRVDSAPAHTARRSTRAQGDPNPPRALRVDPRA